MLHDGRIIKAISGFYYVKDASDGTISDCRARGKFRNQDITPLVGDFISYNKEDKYVMEIKERKNELVRPPICNIDQALLVFSAKEPDFSTILLDKFLLIIENKNIEPIICVSKIDLVANDDRVYTTIEKYRSYGYKIFTISSKSKDGIEKIKTIFKDKVTVVTGQSGVGKSSLLNALDIHLNIETNEISKALGRGKHTTRHVELLEMYDGYVADTPGFSSLELTMTALEASVAYHDFKEYAKECRFRGCLHDKEPGCKVKEMVEGGHIAKDRYDHYLQNLEEIRNKKERY